MALWTGALSGWKCHWPDLKSTDGISSWTPLKPQHSNPNLNPLANQLWCIDFVTPISVIYDLIIMKVMVCSLDYDIEFFSIVTRVLQEDALATSIIIICRDLIQWKSIDLINRNDFSVRKRQERGESIIDSDYQYDRMLRVNTPAEAESLMHILESVAGFIDLFVTKSHFKWQIAKISKPFHTPPK